MRTANRRRATRTVLFVFVRCPCFSLQANVKPGEPKLNDDHLFGSFHSPPPSSWEAYLIECTICTRSIDRPLGGEWRKIRTRVRCTVDCFWLLCFFLCVCISTCTPRCQINLQQQKYHKKTGWCCFVRALVVSGGRVLAAVSMIVSDFTSGADFFGGIHARMGGEFNRSINPDVYTRCGGLCGSATEGNVLTESSGQAGL